MDELSVEAYIRSILSADAWAAYQAAEGEAKEILRAKALSAWNTRPELCSRIVAWAGVQPGQFVLEPASGTGNFTRALRAVGADVTTVDIDPRLSPDVCANYLETSFSGRFHFAIGNPPFEDALDTRFLEKAAVDADDVVFVIRLVALAGKDRFRRVWKHVQLVGLAILPERPDFLLGPAELEMGSARSDFCVVHYSTRENVQSKKVEWWT